MKKRNVAQLFSTQLKNTEVPCMVFYAVVENDGEETFVHKMYRLPVEDKTLIELDEDLLFVRTIGESEIPVFV